ncbi:anthranilate phosphoribosyltransferase [Ketobacter alkanivorans]|uniref:Anthranilate phosphoribosyltransferase n=1 Tax=Ketobacter alkanivorans TaxID=1917421 RepID=A0A2K9LNE5_9GAMM|nr:anthranilate phosphoribosyltransferase [Ketobacter alkanivorans]AUM13802.1 anthranilate phosphoribosyltransferase [Ketobacter alkanivorans]MCP5014658.1 anthranilate phosphoribosyltransferase [Ketobacter sp.]
MNIQTALKAIVEGQNLSESDMSTVMEQIMTGQATPAQIGGFLVGLRMKGETVDEITGAARVMRALATPVSIKAENLVDTCGTGGDGSKTFNISTTVAFVVAAAGGKVAKHGNRSVSSVSGSADVLEAAGVHLGLSPEQVARCVESIGVGFMFAPAHHSAMKHAIGPRKEMAIRTVFNLLGPLTNPAGAKRQVMGVFARQWVRPIAEVLQRLGCEHVLVVHSADGMDEISIGAETFVAEATPTEITEYSIQPEDFGMTRAAISTLAVDSVEDSLAMIKDVLSKKDGPAADIVALNAGAAIYVAGLASSIKEGVALAQDAVGSGLAHAKLGELAQLSKVLQQENAGE